jgi:predicted MFS family arabinose efflux permease
VTRLWLAAVCSETGEWMLQIALPILVYQATGSAASTAAMMIVGLLPAVLLSPAAGVLADRLDRRKLLLAVSAGQAVVAAPLLGMSGSAVWAGYLVMAGQASLAALFEPARNALVRDLVGPDGVTAANGLLGMGTNLSRLTGAWLGGLLFAGGGVTLVYLGYAAVLLVAVGALVKPFGTRHEPQPPGPAVREWLDGIDMIRRDRRLWVIGTAMMMGAVSQGLFLALFVPFVLDVLGAGAGGVGLLRGVQAIGGLLAGAGVAVLARRVASGKLFGWGAVAFGVLGAVMWNGPYLTTALPVYIGLFIAVGVPGGVAVSGLLGILQTAVPPAATGRLTSSAFAAMALGNVLGMLIGGLGAAWSPLMLNLQAALYLASGVLVLVLRPRSAEYPPHAAVAEQASR